MIKHAALLIDGKVYTGKSHAEAVINVPHGADIDSRVAGFMTDGGVFMTREEALPVARAHGQVRPYYKGGYAAQVVYDDGRGVGVMPCHASRHRLQTRRARVAPERADILTALRTNSYQDATTGGCYVG